MCVPDKWKKAKISALFKKGNKNLAGIYRPVSLTCIICKIMEKLIRQHIIDFMNYNGHFSRKQFGFLKGRSISLTSGLRH